MEGAPEHNRTHASHGAGTPKSDQTLQMVVHPTRRIKPRPQIDRCHELHAAPHGPRCDIRFLVRGLRSAPSLGGWSCPLSGWVEMGGWRARVRTPFMYASSSCVDAGDEIAGGAWRVDRCRGRVGNSEHAPARTYVLCMYSRVMHGRFRRQPVCTASAVNQAWSSR